MSDQSPISRRRISAFLNLPGVGSKRSSVYLSFRPTQEVRDVAAAIWWLKTMSPIPFLLRIRGSGDNKCIELECFSHLRMVFGYSPPSDSPANDLQEILAWFAENEILVEVV